MLIMNSRFHLEQKALDQLREEEEKLNYESLRWDKEDFIMEHPKFKSEKYENKLELKKDLKKQEEIKFFQQEKKFFHKLPILKKPKPNTIIDMTKIKREPLTHSINNLKFERTSFIRDVGEISEKNSKKKNIFFYSPRNQIQLSTSFFEKKFEKEYFINKFEEVSKKYGFKSPLANDLLFNKREERKFVHASKLTFQSIQFPNEILNELGRRWQ